MGSKILLADDSQLVLRLAQCFLRTKYTTSTAASGEEAFGRAVTEQPDLILLDRHMPGWSGPATLAALARDERTKHIPVVVMTTEDHIAGLGEGIDHLVKPFDAAALIGKVQERLGAPTPRHAQAPAVRA
jgi:twitching motility two-component system response regulator PilH